MRINRLLIFFVFLAIAAQTKAQFREDFTPGIRMGANFSNITGVESSLLAFLSARPNYLFNEDYKLGYIGGMFFNQKLTDRAPYFSLQGEIDFSMHGAKYSYNSPEQLNSASTLIGEENFELILRYNYLTFGGMFKYYLLNNGFNIGIGPRLGFNISRNNIFYTSNQQFNDLDFQQRLRESFNGLLDFSVMVGIGHEFTSGTTIDARYIIGLTDAIETGRNSFSFLETQNNINAFQLTVGQKIPFFN